MNTNLRKELIEMFNKDQKAAKSLAPTPYDIRVENKKRLNMIIKEFGWPTSDLAGKKGEMAAWLIAQHSDFDVAFQEKCLKLLKKLPQTRERKQHVAYLTDRTLVNRKRKQVYGTQFYHGKSGKLKSRPIRDIRKLEERRKEAGLGPFIVYKKLQESY